MVTLCILFLVVAFIIILARSKKNSNLGLSLLLALGLGVVAGMGYKAYALLNESDVEYSFTAQIEKSNITDVPTQLLCLPVLETVALSLPGIAGQGNLNIAPLLNSLPVKLTTPFNDLLFTTIINDSS